MLQFDINVSILLREYPFQERFDHAARLGFRAVEFWWPSGEDPAAVGRSIRGAGVEVALFNFDAGNMPAGDRGLLNDPDRQKQMHENVRVALDLAYSTGCRRLNALAGKERPGEARESQLSRVADNLAWIAEQARPADVTVMVEALNTFENGPYLLACTKDALALMDRVGAPNIQYQFDVYHMQRMEGNITATMRSSMPRIGHIQIADSPGRNQPGTGELNYRFIFEEIARLGYAGWIGLEYNPKGSSEESLSWLSEAPASTSTRWRL
jgi:hydroxypyruvate isomerase